jgi:hypothetical protein
LSTENFFRSRPGPLTTNVLRIREVRLSKLPVSICTNVYLLILMYQFLLYENNILRSRQLKSKKTSSSPAFFLCAVRGSWFIWNSYQESTVLVVVRFCYVWFRTLGVLN